MKKQINRKVKSDLKSNKTIILLILMIVLYFFYMKSKDLILNFPSWIYYTIFIISVIVLLTNFYTKQIKNKNFDRFQILTNVIQRIILSWFISGIILIPFNYFLIFSVKNNNSLSKKCEIINVSTYTKNRCIFYKLDNQTNVLYGYIPIMEEINENKKFENYNLILRVKKGLFNTYLMEDWNIIKIY